MRRPWFVGTSDLDILGKIFAALGTPTEAQWPGMRDLPNFVDFQKTVAPPLGSIVKGVSTQLFRLNSPSFREKFEACRHPTHCICCTVHLVSTYSHAGL